MGSIFCGMRNGFCFGLDICSINGDLVQDSEGLMIVDGIQFTIGPFFLIWGSWEHLDGDQ